MYHYVYELTSNRDGKKYIGVRSCECAIEEDTYMSSSTEDPDYVKDCSKTILKTFNTRKEANSYEIYLHDLYDVGANAEFFNKAKSTSIGFCTKGNKEVAEKISLSMKGDKHWTYHKKGKLHPSYGKHLSEEHKEKLRKAMTGKKHSQSAKEKMSKSHIGANNPRAKIANIYDYATNNLIAENIVLADWARSKGIVPQHLAATARNTRKQCKGVYARYINTDNIYKSPKEELLKYRFNTWWEDSGKKLSEELDIKTLCEYLWMME